MRKSDIFIVDDNHQLVFDKEYLRGIPEFKTLLERKMTKEGDFDGRKKLMHWQVFMYIKIVADRFSYPNQGGYNDDEVHKAAIKESKLDPGFKPDKDVLAAIEKFREIQDILLPTLSTISTVLKGIRSADVIAQILLKSINDQIKLYEKKIEDAAQKGESINLADQVLIVDGLIKQLNSVQKMAETIPKTQDTLEKLEERLKKETAGDVVGRGGRTIGNRADPKR